MNRLRTTLGSELSGVLLTGVGKFVLADWLGLHLVFIIAASLCWVGFVARRTQADSSALSGWGFTTRGLTGSINRLFPFAVLALIVTIAIGLLTERLLVHWHMLLVFLLYPVWGLVQQFIVVAMVAGNFQKHSRIPTSGIVLLTASLFSGLHIPSLPLVVASFVMAAITTTIYFYARNLWALGVFHGWVATCVYFFALGEDPWHTVVSSWVGSWSG
jgi:hypothetical protein